MPQVLINRETGQVFEVPDEEAETARSRFGLVPASQEQVDWLKKQREYEAKPFSEKLQDTGAAAVTGLMGTAQELGRLRIGDDIDRAVLEPSNPLLQAQEGFQQRTSEYLKSPEVIEREQRHPISTGIGRAVPLVGVSGPVSGLARTLGAGRLGAAAIGMAGESAVVGTVEEAINRTQQGRDFSWSNAQEIAQWDLAFSGAAALVGKVGSLMLFGTGKTVQKNIGRGLDGGPVVPDDFRFENPLLEAEVRSQKVAAATSPDMPPGPERDEMLRKSAGDINRKARDDASVVFDESVPAARESATIDESEMFMRRVDEFLTETTPAQTAWSVEATKRLDSFRLSLSVEGEFSEVVSRVTSIANEAIDAIDSTNVSSEWFRAASVARNRLDSFVDELSVSVGETDPLMASINQARSFLEKSVTDRALFGVAAEIDAKITGAARDKIGAATRAAGGDLDAYLERYVQSDFAQRESLRGPLRSVIEGLDELANAHDRFGTATPNTIGRLRERAETLRRSIEIADDVKAAQNRAPVESGFSSPEDEIRSKAMGAMKGAGGFAGQAASATASAFADTFPNVYRDAVSDGIKAAIGGIGLVAGVTTFGPAGLLLGIPLWFVKRSASRALTPAVSRMILERLRTAAKKHGPGAASVALLASSALADEDDEESLAAMASVGGLFGARRFVNRIIDQAGDAARRGASAAGEAVKKGAVSAGEAVTEAAKRGATVAGEVISREATEAGRFIKEKALTAGSSAYQASSRVTKAFDEALERTARELGTTASKVAEDIGYNAGQFIRREAEALASPENVTKFVEESIRDAIGLSLGPYGRRIAKSASKYVGPKISDVLLNWMRKQSDAGRTAEQTVEDAVSDTAKAAASVPDLIAEHAAKSSDFIDDVSKKFDEVAKETTEQREKILLELFPHRIGGNALEQRKTLHGIVDSLVSDLSTIGGREAASAGEAFAFSAHAAIDSSKLAKDRFRLGILLTETLAEHTAKAGDGEIAKVFGSYTESLWQTMSRKDLWMGERELEREARRIAQGTAKERAVQLDSFPNRIGGNNLDQIRALNESTDEVIKSISSLPESDVSRSAQAFLSESKKAIESARTARDRFRVGFDVATRMSNFAEEAVGSSVAKAMSDGASKLWETMGSRELWLSKRELERESKRQLKKREFLLEQLRAGEDLVDAGFEASLGRKQPVKGKGGERGFVDLAKRGVSNFSELSDDQIDILKEVLPVGMTEQQFDRVLGLDRWKGDWRATAMISEWGGPSQVMVQNNFGGGSKAGVAKDGIGKMSRTFSKQGENRWVTHDEFFIPKSQRGVGKQIIKDSFAIYTQNGIRTVYVDMAIDTGRWLWPFMGFRPDKFAEEEAIAAFREWLQSKPSHGIDMAKFDDQFTTLPSIARTDAGKEFMLSNDGSWNVGLSVNLPPPLAEGSATIRGQSGDYFDPRVLDEIDPDDMTGHMAAPVSQDAAKFISSAGRDFTLGDIAKSPMGVVTAAGAAYGAYQAIAGGDDDEDIAAWGMAVLPAVTRLRARKQRGSLPAGRPATQTEAREALSAFRGEPSRVDAAEVSRVRKALSEGGSVGDRGPVIRRDLVQAGETTPEYLASIRESLSAIPDDDWFQRHANIVAQEPMLATRITGPGGKTPGGVFRGSDGVYRYVKVDKDPIHSLKEVANARMYEALGVPTNNPQLLEFGNGDIAVASQLLGPGWRDLNSIEDWSELPKSVRDSYATQVVIDHVLGNWDVSRNAMNVMTNGQYTLMPDPGEATVNAWDAGWFEKAGGEASGNARMASQEIKATTESASGGDYRRPGGVVGKAAPHDLLRQYADTPGELSGIMQSSFDNAMMTIESFGGTEGFLRNHLPMLSDAEANRAAKEMSVRISYIKAAIPTLAVLMYLSFASDSEAEELDQQVKSREMGAKAASRLVNLDNSADQRIKLTARSLAGVADAPRRTPVSSLERFGEEHGDPYEAFQERKRILLQSEVTPEIVFDVLGESMADVARANPAVYQEMFSRVFDGMRYLRNDLPPEIRTSIVHPTGIPPSESSLRDWAKKWSAVFDPESVLEDIDSGLVTHDQIGALQSVHPDLYERAKGAILEEVAANYRNVPVSTKMQLDILFGADGLAGPMFSSSAAVLISEANKLSAKKQQSSGESLLDAEEMAGDSSGVASIKSSVTNRGSA